MKCIKIKELLTDYLRRETDSPTTAAVANHLEICDDCARELAFLKVYYAKTGFLPTIEAPNNFLADIKQRLDQTETLKRKSRWLSGPLANKLPRIGLIPQITGALTIALIVVLVFNPFQMGQKLRRDANLLQMAPKAAQTEQKDKSEEMVISESNQFQLKNAPAPVTENWTGAANRADNGANSKDEGERRLTLTVSQPALMANKGLTAADAILEERKETGKPDQNVLSKKSVLKKEQGLSASNSSLILAVKNIIGSAAGEIMQEEVGEYGQPSLLIRIPVQNYAAFLEKLKTIGSVNDEGYDLPASPPEISGTIGAIARSGFTARTKTEAQTGTTTQSTIAGQSATAAQSSLQQFIEARLILKGVL
jgi:hypothetical protein